MFELAEKMNGELTNSSEIPNSSINLKSWKRNAGRDQYGRPLGYSYKNRESTLDNAKNYIDNHIKPWAVRLVELGRV